jgi:hypothetical protein
MVKDRVVALADNSMVDLVVRVANKAVVAKVRDKAVLRQSMAENTVAVAVALVPAMVVGGAAKELYVLFGVQVEHSQLVMLLK